MSYSLERRVNALMRLVTATEQVEYRAARNEVLRLMEDSTDLTQDDPEAIVRQILLEIGAPDHQIGHEYIVEGVLLMMKEPRNNLTRGIYPLIAEKCNSTVCRVERGIRHTIETAWNRGDLDVLNHYFGNTVDVHKSRPSNRQFITRIAHVVNQRLRSMR